MARIFWTLVIMAVIVGGGYIYWAVRDLPGVDKVVAEGVNPTKWTQVFGRDGTPILSYGKFHHKNVTLNEISPHFVNALLATEDRRFYSHFGIDPIAIVRAILVDIRHMKLMEGGSTLTQQLARNIFLSHERSMKRKVQEAFLALKLEQELSKEEILELYVNNIYFGEGAYGIHAACEIYFNKKPSELTVDEAATLAGMPQAPSGYNPFLNPEAAKKRRNEVLGNLKEVGKLSDQELAALTEKGFRLNPYGRDISTANRAPYFNQYVMAQVQDLFGLDEQSFWQSGLKIHTTLDPHAQGFATQAVKNQSALHGRKGRNQQAALVSIDARTGAVLAYVGGTNYAESQFDRVTSAVRNPGSLFKVFTYTAAVEQGYTPNRVYLDEPIQAGEWQPSNYDKSHHGYMTMLRALVTSNNVIAVKVMYELSPSRVIQMAQRMGLNSRLEDNLSLTLGSSGVTLLDITSSIGVLANRGIRVEPYVIEKIEDRNGKIVYEHYPMQRNVLDRETTDTMVAMLMGVVQRGTGMAANIGRPVAGKTGTSDGPRDGWFVGFTPEVVTGVWVGNDDNSIVGTTGGGLPAVMWAAYMRPYMARKAVSSFDLAHAHPIAEEDFTSYNIDYLSSFEAGNPLAMREGGMMPTADGLLEADPNIDPFGDPNLTEDGRLIIDITDPERSPTGAEPLIGPATPPGYGPPAPQYPYPQQQPQHTQQPPPDQSFPRQYPQHRPQVIPVPQQPSNPQARRDIIPLPPTSPGAARSAEN